MEIDPRAAWYSELRRWSRMTTHRARLGRACGSINEVLDGNGERIVHSISRLGVWAEGLAQAICAGEVEPSEIVEQLTKISEAGEIAFERWMNR